MIAEVMLANTDERPVDVVVPVMFAFVEERFVVVALVRVALVDVRFVKIAVTAFRRVEKYQ